jgi:hypothetical protein
MPFLLHTFAAEHFDFASTLSLLLDPRLLQTLRCTCTTFRRCIAEELQNKCTASAIARYTRATLFATEEGCHTRAGIRLHSKYGVHTAEMVVSRELNRMGENLSMRIGGLRLYGRIDGRFVKADGATKWHLHDRCFVAEHRKSVLKEAKAVWISDFHILLDNVPTSYRGATMRIHVDMGEPLGVLHADHEFRAEYFCLNSLPQK